MIKGPIIMLKDPSFILYRCQKYQIGRIWFQMCSIWRCQIQICTFKMQNGKYVDLETYDIFKTFIKLQ